MSGARVVVEHLSRSYGRAVVLDDVSFVVEPGEMVALTGPSGSGKTTLLQLIGSLDRPTSGRVIVDDISVGELTHPAKFRRDTVGFVHKRRIRVTVKRKVKVVDSLITNPPTCTGAWTGTVTLEYKSGPDSLPVTAACSTTNPSADRGAS
jgi:ABC-type lipoprotein export system ATPase subunit